MSNVMFEKKEKGQASIEFGVILPAMILLILAVVVYGKPYYQKLVAQNIAYSTCSSVPFQQMPTLAKNFPEGGQLSQAMSTGVNAYVYGGNEGFSGLDSAGLGMIGVTYPFPCLVRLGEYSDVLSSLFAGSDGYARGVAVFFSSPFNNKIPGASEAFIP